jgi:hypothetical protein
LALIDAPSHVDGLIGVTDRRARPDWAEVVVAFAQDRADAKAKMPDLLATTAPSAILWIAYPKLTSPLATDLDRETVRSLAASLGMKVVSQIAIDSDWSAMRMKRI